jgi:PII-like signaling protein
MSDSPQSDPQPQDALLLRIFLSESARWKHQPLYEALIEKARDAGLAGATVLRGPMGFGADQEIHTAKILQLSDTLPVVVEIVDRAESVRAFASTLHQMMDHGVATMQPVTLLRFGKPSASQTDSA